MTTTRTSTSGNWESGHAGKASLDKKARIANFYRYVVSFSGAFLIVAGLVVAVMPSPTLIDVVTACKIGSLVSILWVNGEIAHEIDRSRRGIRAANLVFLGVVALLIMVLLAKLFHMKPTTAPLAAFTQAIYGHLWWLSAFPLFAYGGLNIAVAYFVAGNRTEAAVAQRFVVFVYAVCVAPLLIVFILLYFFSRYLHAPPIDVFTSGSMAVVLLASSFATKAVDTYFK